MHRLDRHLRPLCLLLGLVLGLCAFTGTAEASTSATLDISAIDDGGEEAPSQPVITVKTDDTEPTPLPPDPEADDLTR